MGSITKRNKWSYSVGSLGRDMLFVLVSMFILAYIQYTMNLSAVQFSAISGIMIFARVWDAINDPMMGMIIENARFKAGKFRPWIMIGGITNFFITLLLFTVRPEGWLFVVFFGIAYIAWGMTFTINDIAYWSLLPNLAKDNEERNALTNLVLVFASVGQFLAGGLIPVLVTGNAVLMYKIIGISVSFIFLAFTCITFFGVQEVSNQEDKSRKIEKKDKVGIKKMFQILIQNDQLVFVSIALFLHTIANGLFVAFGINFFYFEFGYGGIQLTIFTVFFGLGNLVALGSFSVLSKKMNRMKILTFSIFMSVIGYVLFLSLGYVFPMTEEVLYLSAFLVFFGQSLFYIVLMIMTANTIEYNEFKTGERNESIVFSVRPFMAKLGAAFQQGILTIVLLSSGIFVFTQQIADLEIQKAQGVVGDITVQANIILENATPFMLLMLRIGMGFIPLLCMISAYFVIKSKYKITEEKYDEMLTIIYEGQNI